MYSYGPPHMAVQKQDDQHEHTFSSYVRIGDVVLKTCLGRWTIGRSGERGSGISVPPAWHDDDDDDDDCSSTRLGLNKQTQKANDWDSNGMTTRLGLNYASMLGNCFHCLDSNFVVSWEFWFVFFFFFFFCGWLVGTWSNRMRIILNKSIWPIIGNPTGTGNPS